MSKKKGVTGNPLGFLSKHRRKKTHRKDDESNPHSHSIHVWYIYLHLVDFYGKLVGEIYRSSHGCVMGSEKSRLASEDLTGLWNSESSYRKSVGKFIDAAENSHQKAAGLARQLREDAERYRALSKRRGVLICFNVELSWEIFSYIQVVKFSVRQNFMGLGESCGGILKT